MGRNSFNNTTASRTRCAKHIRDDAGMLAMYQAVGGLPKDLDNIIVHGELAEAFNLTQNQTASESAAAAGEIARSFLTLKRENSAVASVVHAVIHDLEGTGKHQELATRLEKILANEAQLQFSTIEVEGAKKRKTTRSLSNESVRNEIEKDASALIALTEAHPFLAERKVEIARLEALRDHARSLAGKLADRAAKRGAKVTATQQEHEAVALQSQAWAACYRLLALVGARDPRVQEMLREASRTR